VVIASVVRSADVAAPASAATNRADAASGKDTDAQIDTLVRYAMPGAPHKLLDRLVGRWDAATRYWMAPDAEPVESAGTCERKWILDGRFVMEELDGGNLALPFRALGLFGYDAFEQKYTSAWLDTMNTSILTNLGAYDKTNDVVNFTGEYKDPWSGTKKKERGVMRFLGQDKLALEIHVADPGGKEFKMLEVTYTRKRGESK
jgi:hypothetical protein